MNQLLPEPVFPTHVEFSAGTSRVSYHTSVPLCRHRMLGCPSSPILLIGLAGFVAVRAFRRASRNVRSLVIVAGKWPPKCHLVWPGPTCWGRDMAMRGLK